MLDMKNAMPDEVFEKPRKAGLHVEIGGEALAAWLRNRRVTRGEVTEVLPGCKPGELAPKGGRCPCHSRSKSGTAELLSARESRRGRPRRAYGRAGPGLYLPGSSPARLAELPN